MLCSKKTFSPAVRSAAIYIRSTKRLMDISLDILNDSILSSKDYVTLKWLENIGSNISYLLSAMLLCMLVLTQQYRLAWNIWTRWWPMSHIYLVCEVNIANWAWATALILTNFKFMLYAQTILSIGGQTFSISSHPVTSFQGHHFKVKGYRSHGPYF